MKNFNKNSNGKMGISIIGILFLVVIIILVLSYFNISIKSVAESPTGKENISYVTDNTKSIWESYLKDPATYLWNDVWLNIFW